MTSNLPLPPSPTQSAGSALNLDDVLSRSFRKPADGGGPVDDAVVIDAVRQVPAGRWADRVEMLLEGFSLSARQRGALVVAERVLRAWCRQPAFHPQLGEALLRCSGGVVACALAPESWLARRRHPVHEVLDVITHVAQAWYPGHPHARVLKARLCAWLDRIRGPGDAVRVRGVAQAWHRRYLEDLQGRLSEQPAPLGAEYARRKAAAVIDRQLAGRQQPAFMVRDLHEHWWPALAGVLAREGEGSTLFREPVRLLSMILWALHPGAVSPKHHAKLQRIADELRQRLPALLSTLINDPEASRRMMEHIEVNLYSVLHFRQVRREPVPPLSREPLPPAVHVSADLMEALERIGERDWFAMKPGDERVRVFLKGEQAMLVSQARQKLLVCTRRELAWRLANGELAPVPAPVSSSELILERLRILARELDRDPGRTVSPETAASGEPVPAARGVAGRPPTHVAEPPGDGSPESYRLARIAVAGLAIGARLRFLDEDQSWRVIMKLPSSGLFLLVDNRGLDRREIFGSDLMQALAEGEAEMIHPGEDGDYFNRVVRSIEGERRHKAR